jgi:hypothetical protein
MKVEQAIKQAKKDIKRTKMSLFSASDLFTLALLYMLEDLTELISSQGSKRVSSVP